MGVISTSSRPRSACAAGSDSTSSVSSAQPAISPPSNAAASAAVSTSTPRDAFTRIADCFMRRSAAASIMPRVFAVSGACNDTMSAAASTSSSNRFSPGISKGGFLHPLGR